MYYLRATNSETGWFIDLTVRTFTNKVDAEDFAESLLKMMNPVARVEIIMKK